MKFDYLEGQQLDVMQIWFGRSLQHRCCNRCHSIDFVEARCLIPEPNKPVYPYRLLNLAICAGCKRLVDLQ